jgi:hypothetical protein
VIAVDGNAMAGALYDFYGHEMTAAVGVCGSCGASAHVAQLVVYETAAGSVARCPSCGAVLIVSMLSRGETQVDIRGLSALEGVK